MTPDLQLDELARLFSCPELAGFCDDSHVREALVDRDVKLGAKRRLLELWARASTRQTVFAI